MKKYLREHLRYLKNLLKDNLAFKKKIKKLINTLYPKSLLKKSLFTSFLIHVFLFFILSSKKIFLNLKKDPLIPIAVIQPQPSKSLSQNLKKQNKLPKKLPKKRKKQNSKGLKSKVLKEEKKSQNINSQSNKKSKKIQHLDQITKLKSLRGLKKIEFLEYEKQIRDHIRQFWSLPHWLTNKDFKTYALIFIDSTGRITRKELFTSSQNEVFDTHVLNVIEKSSPLPPPPRSLRSFFKEGLILRFPN